jgi:hypothetical protein
MLYCLCQFLRYVEEELLGGGGCDTINGKVVSEEVRKTVQISGERLDTRKEGKEKQRVVFAFKRGPEDKKNEKENREDFSREVTYNLEKFWTSEAVEKGNQGNQRQLKNEGNRDFDSLIRAYKPIILYHPVIKVI